MSEILFYRIPATPEGTESETRIAVRMTGAGLALIESAEATPIAIEFVDEMTVRLATRRGAFLASAAVIEHVSAAQPAP